MRQFMLWIRSTPITVFSVVAVIVAVGVLVWAWLGGGALRQEMADANSQINEFRQLQNQSVTIPAREAGGTAREISGITYNLKTIETLKMLVGGLDRELRELQGLLVERNKAEHEPMLSGILPEPRTAARGFEAVREYRRVLPAMLQAPGADEDTHLPRLNAGSPPNLDTVAQEISRLSQSYREDMASTMGGEGAQGELSSQEIERLNQRKREHLRRLLKDRAEALNLYAQTNPDAQDFPLDWASLRNATSTPAAYEIWEAQFELWIQQDVLKAIALANQADDPDANVLTAPVKRLIDLQVVPGYVGLHTRGGVLSGSATLPYQLPSGDYKLPDEDEPIRNFLVSPTGRVSNAVYDVRHVRLEIIADYQKLPQLYDAISNVNLMTVVHCNIRDVDEYAAYREGYLYGDAEAVRLTMVIETLWMRQWTRPLMPDRVRQYLAIPRREADEDASPQDLQEPDVPPDPDAPAGEAARRGGAPTDAAAPQDG